MARRRFVTGLLGVAVALCSAACSGGEPGPAASASGPVALDVESRVWGRRSSAGAYVAIAVDGRPFLPGEDDVARMRAHFVAAGIDPARYAVFA